jgi:hypothetical protein
VRVPSRKNTAATKTAIMKPAKPNRAPTPPRDPTAKEPTSTIAPKIRPPILTVWPKALIVLAMTYASAYLVETVVMMRGSILAELADMATSCLGVSGLAETPTLWWPFRLESYLLVQTIPLRMGLSWSRDNEGVSGPPLLAT